MSDQDPSLIPSQESRWKPGGVEESLNIFLISRETEHRRTGEAVDSELWSEFIGQ